jgi:T5SS/PEP-CTERM-associated repeat protein
MARHSAQILKTSSSQPLVAKRVASLALLTTAISALLCGGAASADPALNWTGNTDNDWFKTTNWEWDANVIPTPTREARIDHPDVIIAGPTIAKASNLLVGLGSTGSLTIDGTLETTTAALGWNTPSTGTISLSGPSATWSNSGGLYLGNEGSGILTIDNMASVSAGTTYLGAGYGGTGQIDLGGGANFTSSGDLYIGYAGVGGGSQPAGTGVVNVTSGTLWNTNGTLANGTGSTGTATITGGSSFWINTGTLTVGRGGVGTLTVSAGGSVSSIDGVIGQSTDAAGSSATVTGAGSTWNASGTLFVGNFGASELNVLSGGAVTSVAAVIGRHSTSTATVSGVGSSWNTGALSVGGDIGDPGTAGNGTLAISSGGSVTSSSAALGLNSTDSGTATIGGSGSIWDVNGTLSVGFNGTGTVTVSDNARLETAWMIIGHNAGSTGSATVTSGASLVDAGYLYVGNDGDGTLTISDGGSVTSVQGYVGTANGSDGTATVTGRGSSWTMTEALFVGQSAGSTGTMTISGGATVTDVQGIVGDLAGSNGSLTVTGAGSTWTSLVTSAQYSGDINAGRLGTGSITVSDGGKVIGNRFYAGNEVGSSGTVVVTGAGSSIATTDRFVVGSEGTGVATVSNGGTISAATIRIAAQAGSTGTLNVGAAHGSAAAAAGTLDTSSIRFGAGTGLLEFNFTDPSYVVSAAISGAGRVQLDAGNLTLSGVNTYTGGTTVNGGTLNVTGSLSGSATEVTMRGGQLVNSGTISGSTYGVELATTGNVVSTSGSISGGTAAVFFGAGNNTLNISPTATFNGLVDYNNTQNNTTGFGVGSYRIAAARYDDLHNVITLNNDSQKVILDNANSASGYINVVAIPAASREASQYTSSVSDVIGSILSLDVARPDQISVGGSTISALQYGEDRRETQEGKAVRMLGDNAAVDNYGNLFWTRAFGGLRYQPSSDSGFSNHTSHVGVISGVDHLFENYRLGFFAGAGTVRTAAGDSASLMRGNTGFLGLYGAVELGGLQWNASITGGGIENMASRSINNGTETASGDFTGWYVSPEVAVSRSYQVAPGWQLTPSFKTRYTGAYYEGYDESGSSQDLSYGARQSHSIDGRLQVELKYKTVMPSGLPAAITATAALSDTQYLGSETLRASLNANEFTVTNTGDKNVLGATLGVGFDAMISERTAIYGGIDGSLYSDDSVAASGRLGLKVAF